DDLLARVPLRRKEWMHLVQCGALDGLGASRMAMLAAAGGEQAGNRRINQRRVNHREEAGARQMAFEFVAQAVAAESDAQRLAWEQRILGLPVSLHPLQTLAETRRAGSLAQARARPGQLVEVDGTRLPGQTGGRGWFLADPVDYALAVLPKGTAAPRPWRPIRVAGRWQQDPWGNAWLQVERWSPLEREPHEGAG
ncbi:MAG TPA: hypothetical protein VNK95_10370, partial [Caldilineaceae bacterium]|nr:hypothetical protein [Caldilineaceae bacterium]